MDNGSSPDLNSSTNSCVRPNVHIFADMHLFTHALSSSSFHHLEILWHDTCVDRYAGSDLRVASNGDPAGIEEFTTATDCNTLSDRDVIPIIAHEWRVNEDVRPAVSCYRHVMPRTGVGVASELGTLDPTRSKDRTEVAHAFVGCDLNGRVGGVVEAEDSTFAAFAFIYKLGMVW
jgi:hypothetical protein